MDYMEIFKDDEELKQKCQNYVKYFVNFWNNRIYSFSNLAYDSFKKPKREKTYNKNLIRDMKIVFDDDDDAESVSSHQTDDYNYESDCESDSEYSYYDFDKYEIENSYDYENEYNDNY